MSGDMEVNPRAAYLPITLVKGEPLEYLLCLQTWAQEDINLGNCTATLNVAGIRDEQRWEVGLQASGDVPGGIVVGFPDIPAGRYYYEVWVDFGSEEPTLHTRRQKLIEGGLTMMASLVGQYEPGNLPELAVGHREILVRVGPAEQGLIKAQILYPGYMAEKMESARHSAEAAKQSEDHAKESENKAKDSENKAKDSENKAKESEKNAVESERNAKQSEEAAKRHEEAAEKYAEDARKSEGKSSWEHWLELHPGGTFEQYMFELSGEEWMRDHVEDKDIHIQDGEREKWNTGLSDLQAELAEAMRQLSEATGKMADMAEKLQGTQEGAEAAKALGEAAKAAAEASTAVAEAAKALAESANKAAQQATQAANEAKGDAQQAKNNASAAQQAAQRAESTASSAQQLAQQAMEKAQQALNGMIKFEVYANASQIPSSKDPNTWYFAP